MRQSSMSRSSFGLIRSPSYRQQAARRRWTVVCAIAGLAIFSGVLGSLSARPEPAAHARTGPFSYFPYQ